MAIAAGGFFAGIAAGFSGGILGGSVAFAGASAFGIGTIIGSFVATNAVSLLAGVSLLAIQAAQASRPMAATLINVRVEIGPRWHHCGRGPAAGQVVFGDFDADGNFWYLIYHSDSELLGEDFTYKLDDIDIEVDGDGKVTTEAFWSETEGLLGGLLPGETKPFFTIWTRTHTPADRVPPRVAEFDLAFPSWTADHKLVGTTFSVIKIDAVDKKSKPNIYKWQQGAMRMQEPGLTVIGDWGRVYDPRDGVQDGDDETTWGSSNDNPELIGAWNRYRPWGFNRPMTEIDWVSVALEADRCDATWTNKYDEDLPTYACSVAFPEEKDNGACQAEILLACDGSIFEDDLGRWRMRVGRYETPSLTLSTDRDILDIESRDAQDGESEVDGFVVRYLDASLGYISQVSAPWVNPAFYVPGRTPRYREVRIEGIKHHSLACKAAKIAGSRTQFTRKVAAGVGPRAILAMDEAIVALDHPRLAGDYQIVEQVELAPDLKSGVVAMVPASPGMWVLGPDEEGDKPRNDSADEGDAVPMPSGVAVASEGVPGSGSTSVVVLVATFAAYTSPIYSAEFVYSSDGGETWQPFTTNMASLTATTPPVAAGVAYLVRWRTVTTGGRSSLWLDPPVTVLATTPPLFSSTGTKFSSTSFKWSVVP